MVQVLEQSPFKHETSCPLGLSKITNNEVALESSLSAALAYKHHKREIKIKQVVLMIKVKIWLSQAKH